MIENKQQLGYLNDNQKLFYKALERHFGTQHEDIIKTIVYMQRNPSSLHQSEYQAMKSLSTKERNQVICELLLPF